VVYLAQWIHTKRKLNIIQAFLTKFGGGFLFIKCRSDTTTEGPRSANIATKKLKEMKKMGGIRVIIELVVRIFV
jgi:hypothetical protein